MYRGTMLEPSGGHAIVSVPMEVRVIDGEHAVLHDDHTLVQYSDTDTQIPHTPPPDLPVILASDMYALYCVSRIQHPFV